MNRSLACVLPLSLVLVLSCTSTDPAAPAPRSAAHAPVIEHPDEVDEPHTAPATPENVGWCLGPGVSCSDAALASTAACVAIRQGWLPFDLMSCPNVDGVGETSICLMIRFGQLPSSLAACTDPESFRTPNALGVMIRQGTVPKDVVRHLGLPIAFSVGHIEPD